MADAKVKIDEFLNSLKEKNTLVDGVDLSAFEVETSLNDNGNLKNEVKKAIAKLVVAPKEEAKTKQAKLWKPTIKNLVIGNYKVSENGLEVTQEMLKDADFKKRFEHAQLKGFIK